jgi:hypothetical protein
MRFSKTALILALLSFSLEQQGRAQSRGGTSQADSKSKGKTKSKAKSSSPVSSKSKSVAKAKSRGPVPARSAPEPAAAHHAAVPAGSGSVSASSPQTTTTTTTTTTAPPAAAPDGAPAPFSSTPTLPPAAAPDGVVAPSEPAPSSAPGASAVADSESSLASEGASSSPLQLSIFVDAYVAWQSSGNGTLATLSGHRAFSGQGATQRAEDGFALAFLGLDVSYQTPRLGATASLRFGEGAPIYHAHTDSESDFSFGVDLLTQAYLTWRPWDPLALDLGMFQTPFGAELLESWKNLNYTRGALYYYAQPAWHTGLRLGWEPSEALRATLFIANGSNNLSETQQGGGLDQTPTIGAQLGVSPWPALSLLAGGLIAVDGRHNDDAGFDALGDFVATLELAGVKAVFNADYIWTRDGAPSGADRHFFGFSLAAGYAFAEAFGLAARVEYLLDDANFDAGDQDRWRLFTATLTTDIKPLPHTPNLIVRWDNRWEQSNQRVFGADAKGTADTADDSYQDVWFESVIGVVVTSAP